MPRNKPYRKRVAALDLCLLLLTGGGWIIGIALRELYAWSQPGKK